MERMEKKCFYLGHRVIYGGPFKAVTDDDDHVFPRGVEVEVCTDTVEKLQRVPFNRLFKIIEPSHYAQNPRSCK